MSKKALFLILALLIVPFLSGPVKAGNSIIFNDEGSGWSSSSTGVTLSTDTTAGEFLFGASSLKAVTTSSTAYFLHTTGGFDWSAYDGLCFYIKGTAGKTITFSVRTDSSNYLAHTITFDGSWQYVRWNWADFTPTGSPNLASIATIHFNLNSAHSCTLYFDYLFIFKTVTNGATFTPKNYYSTYNISGIYVTDNGNLTYTPSEGGPNAFPVTLTVSGDATQIGNVAMGLFNMRAYNLSYPGYPYDGVMINLTIPTSTVVYDTSALRWALATSYSDDLGNEYFLEYDLWDSNDTLVNGFNATYIYCNPLGSPPTVEVKTLNATIGTNYLVTIPIGQYRALVYNHTTLHLNSIYLVAEKTSLGCTWATSAVLYGMWLYSDYPSVSTPPGIDQIKYTLLAGAIILVAILVLYKFMSD